MSFAEPGPRLKARRERCFFQLRRSTKGVFLGNRSMKTGLILGAIGLIAAASIGVSADPQGTQASPGPAVQPVSPAAPKGPALQGPALPDAALVQKYCLTCHSARVKTGGLSLEGMNPADAAAHADVWEKVRHEAARRDDAAAGHAASRRADARSLRRRARTDARPWGARQIRFPATSPCIA